MTPKYPIAPQNTGEVIIYQTADGQTSIDVKMENETVWLTQAQMSMLFQKDQSVIARHIQKVFREGELDENSNMQIFHNTLSKYKPTRLYNLDVTNSANLCKVCTSSPKWNVQKMHLPLKRKITW